ncbi:MAG: FtsW/RodA/SpoVE family cell cycle protein, partial [Ignavibacteriae bacterium]|nr:FtsW/RodA/SpoVE family cell cycle protein [Ignavibacteriota bacterium]
KLYRKITKPILLITILVLGITLVLGGEVKGATRFLRLGGFGFQPSEFAKYALIFHLCTLITDKKEKIKDFKHGFAPMMLWIGLVTVLVLLQPNFSNGAMILLIGLLMLYVGRARIAHIALTFSVLLPVLGAYIISAPYRLKRVTDFIEMLTGFVLGHGVANGKVHYQVLQGIIGFGNGGILGVGPGESRQRDFYLPESYGDFVFSIVGEEYGLVGTLFFILLFLLIMSRGMKIAKNARDDFGRSLAAGIVCSITLYALINAGVTLGVVPTTGLPMPFVSYGGSSILFSSIAIGVLLNISSQTDMHPRLARTPESVRPVDPIQTPAVGKVY